MSNTTLPPARLSRGVNALGVTTIVASLVGLVLGLVVVDNLSDDLRATTTLSKTAVQVIADTIALIDDAAGEIDASLDAAVGSVEAASATASAAAAGLENVAGFLDDQLPTQLEAIGESMPAAIQAAAAIDSTLRALSLLGVEYSPEEPFDESLRRVEEALTGLPDELRAQSETMLELAPAAANLADESGRLAGTLAALREDLGSLQDLTAVYEASVEQAVTTIEAAESSLTGTAWLLRALIISAGVVGIAVGTAILLLARDRVESRT